MKATKHGRQKGTFKKRMTQKQLILLISTTQLSLNKNDNFLKKWANPGLFFVYFRSFSNKHYYNFTTD